MPRGRDTRGDPSRQVSRERTIAEHDDTFRQQPGWAMWSGGSGVTAPGDPYDQSSYEYYPNMGAAEGAMKDRYYNRGGDTPAVGQDQEMHWHIGSEPWNASEPYPDARIYQNQFEDPTSVTEEPTYGWERT